MMCWIQTIVRIMIMKVQLSAGVGQKMTPETSSLTIPGYSSWFFSLIDVLIIELIYSLAEGIGN